MVKKKTGIKTENSNKKLVVTRESWLAKGKFLYGDDIKLWKFRCVSCGEVQTGQEFIDAGLEGAEGKIYFSCIGRWVKGRGCDWTLGGLLRLHKVEVDTGDGENIPVFDFAD